MAVVMGVLEVEVVVVVMDLGGGRRRKWEVVEVVDLVVEVVMVVVDVCMWLGHMPFFYFPSADLLIMKESNRLYHCLRDCLSP